MPQDDLGPIQTIRPIKMRGTRQSGRLLIFLKSAVLDPRLKVFGFPYLRAEVTNRTSLYDKLVIAWNQNAGRIKTMNLIRKVEGQDRIVFRVWIRNNDPKMRYQAIRANLIAVPRIVR